MMSRAASVMVSRLFARPSSRVSLAISACSEVSLPEQENEVLRWAAAYLSQANLPGKALPARERTRRRRQSRLGKLTPIEYETIMTTTAITAA